MNITNTKDLNIEDIIFDNPDNHQYVYSSIKTNDDFIKCSVAFLEGKLNSNPCHLGRYKLYN